MLIRAIVYVKNYGKLTFELLKTSGKGWLFNENLLSVDDVDALCESL